MSANIKPAASTALVLQDEGGTDVITISTSGNVGIGNGSPAQKLDVTGSINATGALTLGTALAIAEGGTGATTASAARVALDLEIGVDVEAYSATNADYSDATANFTGTLQNGGSNVLVDTDIGSTVQAYDADTTKNDVSNTFSANQIISVSDNSNAALRITQTGTGNALIVEDSSPDGTPFVVDAGGSVLLGAATAATSGKMQIIRDTADANASQIDFAKGRSAAIVQSGDVLGNVRFLGYDGAAFIRGAELLAEVDGTPGANDMPGRLSFSTTADGSSTPTERMRIDSSGKVGIGTSSPSSILHLASATPILTIEDTSGATASVSRTCLLRDNDSFQHQVRNSSGTFTATSYRVDYNATGVDAHKWYRANTLEAMRIDSSGNVLIGYTSSNGSYKLQVNSQIFATSALIATSDGRYKENVTSLDGALDLVAQLNPVQFTWKEHPVHEFDRSQPTVGFIAQEVQEVLKDTPYVNSIIKANECLVGEERDEEGNIITEGTSEEFLGIAEGNLIALLTKALQEANAKIDALETRIQALEV